MQNNLKALHQQFQQKQQQFSKIGSKISRFVFDHKDKLFKNRLIARNKFSSLKQRLKTIKSDFDLMKKDIEVYKDIPNSFILMAAELPRRYENFWQNRQIQLIRRLQIKEEECRMLKEKLDEKHLNYDQIRLEVENTQSKDIGIDEQQKQERFEVFQKQETKMSMNEMDFTIKGVFCDRRTQKFSQQQYVSIVKQLKQRKSVTDLNSESFHEKRKCEASLQFMKNEPNKRDSIQSIFSQRNKAENKKKNFGYFANEKSPQKDKFWKDLQKQIKKNSKSLSQNKQNHSTQFVQLNSRLLGTESQILGCKMNEFRRELLSRNKKKKQF